MLTISMLLSCSNGRKYVIAVSQCSEDAWRDKLNGELVAGAYFYNNIELKIVSAKDDDKTQAEQINRFIKEKVDLLIVSPNQMNTLTPVIDRAYDAGIPVILFDRKTRSDKYTAFIGADNYEVGRAVGQYVAAHAGNEPFNVIEIQGLRGSSPTIERHRGFTDALKAHPDIHVVASRHADWLKGKARLQTDSILMMHGDIDCVFGQNDQMALGAREVIMRRMPSRGDILYVGVDALASPGGGMEAVRDGRISASYFYPTRGDLVLQLAMNILNGKPYKKDNYMKAALVTKDNVEQMLMQNEEMQVQARRIEEAHDKVDTYLMQYNHQKIYLVLIVIIFLLCSVLFVYIYRVIIRRRRMAEEAADAKLQFFTNVSHEFRTPLTLIADPVERLLDDDTLTTEQRRLLNTANKNVKVVLRLVREILDFRKTQKGKMHLKLSAFNLTMSLREWTDAFLPAAEKRDISLKFDTRDDITVTADKEKIESVVYNLLSNAIKYACKGGAVCLSVSRRGEAVEIKVADNGAGIPKESLHMVFDRFFQAGTLNVGGTGIGLAIVKAFTELHGGRVSVESHEGRGTVFTVVLPVECSSHTVAATSLPQPPATGYAVRGMTVDKRAATADAGKFFDAVSGCYGERLRVLVVDDNEDVRSYVASVLCDTYDVYEAPDGQSGLDTAFSKVPDIIICDVMMPVMDGLEMCRRIKAETATSHIPVLMLTAMTQDGQRAEGYDCGADGYITKPFSSKVLLARIKNLLESRHRLREIYSSGEVPAGRPVDADTVFVSNLRARIIKNLSDSDFSVETLSSEMGLSRVQLYRKVKAITNHTPVEFIRIVRLRRAESLLKQGGRTVSEVSYEVGFSSPSYFSKCFKEYFGRLPGDV